MAIDPRPTLATVARAAGVSLKTASRVMNDEPHVAPGTRERVRAAALELGFRRNAFAADLARGGTAPVVGFVTADIANRFYASIGEGMERALRGTDHQLVTASSDEDPVRERQLTEAFLERRVAALVIAPTDGDHGYLAREVEHGPPVVLVDRPALGIEADTVVIDNDTGVRQAVDHLVAHGHRRIGLVGDHTRLWTARERRLAFVRAVTGHGLPDPGRWIRDGAHDAAAAQHLVTELLDAPDHPTALLTTNNRITTGALHALAVRRTVGKDVPALVGFDDLELADLLGVTVVAYDMAEIGRQAVFLALQRTADPGLPARLRTVPTRVVARGSGEVLPPPDAPA